MTVSQLAPPSMVMTPGSSSCTRRSSASDATCCSKLDVQPITRAPVASTRRAVSSTNSVAASRSASRSAVNSLPRAPDQTCGYPSLAWRTWRRYSASRSARRGSSPKAAPAKVHSPARNTMGRLDAHSEYRRSPTLSANHRLA